MHFKIESGARLFQQLSGYQMIENNGNVPLQLDWVLGRNSVSKSAVLLTERVFESDLVSKMPDLLTELVFEIDLVSKMPDLLTE